MASNYTEVVLNLTKEQESRFIELVKIFNSNLKNYIAMYDNVKTIYYYNNKYNNNYKIIMKNNYNHYYNYNYGNKIFVDITNIELINLPSFMSFIHCINNYINKLELVIENKMIIDNLDKNLTYICPPNSYEKINIKTKNFTKIQYKFKGGKTITVTTLIENDKKICLLINPIIINKIEELYYVIKNWLPIYYRLNNFNTDLAIKNLLMTNNSGSYIFLDNNSEANIYEMLNKYGIRWGAVKTYITHFQI